MAVLTVLIAMLGGAIRVSTPFMFVALGECLTEKSGRVESRPRRHAGARRDGRLRDVVSHRFALGRRALRGGRGLAARRDARLDLPPAEGQRCRGRHRNDAVRRRRRLLLRQTLHPADGAAPRRHSLRILERQRRPAQRVQVNPLFLVGIAVSFAMAWALEEHALGSHRAHGRRQRCRPRERWAFRSTSCGC